jgi:hypothetical protein
MKSRHGRIRLQMWIAFGLLGIGLIGFTYYVAIAIRTLNDITFSGKMTPAVVAVGVSMPVAFVVLSVVGIVLALITGVEMLIKRRRTDR